MSRKWLWIHRWTGLMLGGFLAVQGLLGAWLIVAEPLDRWLHPELFRSQPPADESEVSPIGLARAYRQVAAAFPNRHLWLLEQPQDTHGVYRAILEGEHGPRVYVDAYSGKVRGQRLASSTLKAGVRRLHTGEIGGSWLATAMGLLAVALLGLAVTGLVVWWPGWGRLRWALGFSAASWPVLARDGHRWLGVLAWPFLGLIAFAGIYLIFHHAFQETANAVTGEAEFPPPLELAKGAGPPVSPDVAEIVDRTRERVAGAAITLLEFPAEPGRPIQARLRYPDEWHPLGNSTVLLHPESARVLAAYDLKEAGLGHYALDHLYPLHIGTYGGMSTRVLHFLVGVLPALFFASGLYLWLSLRLRRRRRSACRARGGSAPPG